MWKLRKSKYSLIANRRGMFIDCSKISRRPPEASLLWLPNFIYWFSRGTFWSGRFFSWLALFSIMSKQKRLLDPFAYYSFTVFINDSSAIIHNKLLHSNDLFSPLLLVKTPIYWILKKVPSSPVIINPFNQLPKSTLR